LILKIRVLSVFSLWRFLKSCAVKGESHIGREVPYFSKQARRYLQVTSYNTARFGQSKNL
jgi:hypothetical protein